MTHAVDASLLTTARRMADEAVRARSLSEAAFDGECLHLLLQTLLPQIPCAMKPLLRHADSAAEAIYTSESITAAHHAAIRCQRLLAGPWDTGA